MYMYKDILCHARLFFKYSPETTVDTSEKLVSFPILWTVNNTIHIYWLFKKVTLNSIHLWHNEHERHHLTQDISKIKNYVIAHSMNRKNINNNYMFTKLVDKIYALIDNKN